MPNPQAPKAFWEVHDRVGEIDLSPHSRLLVSAVMRENQWFIRLCPYRLSERPNGAQQWVSGNQVLLLPPEVAPTLMDLLQRAVTRVPGPEQPSPTEQEPPAGLGDEELDAEDAAQLPDRAAMTLILPGFGHITLPAGEAGPA